MVGPSRISPDGSRVAVPQGATVLLIDPRPGTEELAYRRWATRPDPDWHAAEADRHERAGEPFAAAFHLGRLASLRPWDAAPLHARRAAALARIGRTDLAAAAYVQAVLADPAFDFASLPSLPPRPVP